MRCVLGFVGAVNKWHVQVRYNQNNGVHNIGANCHFQSPVNSLNLSLAKWQRSPTTDKSGGLGYLRLEKTGTSELDSTIGFNDSTIGRIAAVVQFVMGLRVPQACLLLWIAVPEDCKSRGSGLPDTVKTWHMGEPSASEGRNFGIQNLKQTDTSQKQPSSGKKIAVERSESRLWTMMPPMV